MKKEKEKKKEKKKKGVNFKDKRINHQRLRLGDDFFWLNCV